MTEDIQNTEKKKPKWRKLGGGTHTMANGRVIKPGEVFEADERELGGLIGRYFERLEPKPKVEPAPADDTSQVSLEIRHTAGGWYDVINKATGKPLNAVKLRVEQAKTLAGTLGLPDVAPTEQSGGENAQDKEPEIDAAAGGDNE